MVDGQSNGYTSHEPLKIRAFVVKCTIVNKSFRFSARFRADAACNVEIK